MAGRCHVCRELGIPPLNPCSQTEHQHHGFTPATLRIMITYSIVSLPKPSPGEPPGTWGHATNLSCLVSPTCDCSCSHSPAASRRQTLSHPSHLLLEPYFCFSAQHSFSLFSFYPAALETPSLQSCPFFMLHMPPMEKVNPETLPYSHLPTLGDTSNPTDSRPPSLLFHWGS